MTCKCPDKEIDYFKYGCDNLDLTDSKINTKCASSDCIKNPQLQIISRQKTTDMCNKFHNLIDAQLKKIDENYNTLLNNVNNTNIKQLETDLNKITELNNEINKIRQNLVGKEEKLYKKTLDKLDKLIDYNNQLLDLQNKYIIRIEEQVKLAPQTRQTTALLGKLEQFGQSVKASILKTTTTGTGGPGVATSKSIGDKINFNQQSSKRFENATSDIDKTIDRTTLKPFKVEQSVRNTYLFLDDGFIGGGSFGLLYKAVRVSDGELVAVKIVIEPYSSPDAPQKIKVEMDAFENTAVCGKYVACSSDYYIVDDHARIVMNLISGVFLTGYMFYIPLEKRQARNDVAISLIQAFDQIFNIAKVTHQDVKDAGNIMWDFERESPVVIDFGESCSLFTHCSNPIMCEKPCGFLGTVYTTPYDSKFRKILDVNEKVTKNLALTKEEQDIVKNPFPKYGISFDETRAHDIWSLGVVLLRWYTYDQDKLQNRDHIYKWSDEQIKAKIKEAPEKFSQEILTLLLERNEYERLKNWEKCVNSVKTLRAYKHKFNTDPNHIAVKEKYEKEHAADLEQAGKLLETYLKTKHQLTSATMISGGRKMTINALLQFVEEHKVDKQLTVKEILDLIKHD